MNDLLNFKIIKNIIFEKSWVNFFLIGSLFLSFKNFFSTIMIQNGIEIKDTLLILGCIYLFSGIINFSVKNVYKSTLKIYSFLIICLIGFSIFYNEYFVFFISMAILIISLLNSSLMVQSYSFFNDLSIKNETKIEKIIISSLFISMLISPLILSFLGYIGDKNHLYYYFSGLIIVCFVFININSEFLLNKKTIIDNDLIFKNPSSKKIHLICSLSFFVNMIRNVFVFFYIPLSVLTITKNLGIESRSLSIIGLIASIGSLVSFASNIDKNKKNKNAKNTMFIHAFSCICIFLFISLVIYKFLEQKPIFVSIICIILIIMLEISSKLWSVGFFGFLNEESKSKIENQKNLKLYNIYFMIGISFGFFITYFSYNYFNINIIMIILSIISGFYTFFLYFYFKKFKMS